MAETLKASSPESMDVQNGLVPPNFEMDSKLLSSERLDFRFERVQLQFDLRNDLTELHVANNIMYILTSSLVFRIDLQNPSDVVRVAIPSISDKASVTRSWVHQNGKYLIIQVNRTQYFVLHMSYRKFKVLPRFKGLDIRSMAFNNSPSDLTTGDFLFVTSEGSIYVAQLKHHDPATQETKRDDKYTKQLFNAKSPALAICYSQKYRQIQLFLESQMLAWDCVEPTLDEITRSFRKHPITSEIPSASKGALILALGDYYYYSTPKTAQFACNDEEAVLACSNKLPTNDLFLSNLENSAFMSPHHYVHLVQNELEIIAIDKLLSQEPVIKSSPQIATGEKILGLSVDYTGETYWLYTSSNIYEILFTNEASSVWYSYYKLGNYDKALEVLNSAQETSKTWFQKNVVMVKQGYDLLQKGGFGIDCESDSIHEEEERLDLQKQGIKMLALLQEQFEKVCLLLMNNNEQSVKAGIASNELLLVYLTVKFDNARKYKNKIQQVALSSWIVKLYLRILYVVRENFLAPSGILPDASAKDQKIYWEKHWKDTDESLSNFLATNHKALDQLTIYQLMKEFGFYDKVISFAELLQDFEYIVDYKIETEDWPGALKALAKLYAKDPETGKAAIYRTSEDMLVNYSKQTVETWLRFPDLDYEQLLPAILSYNKNPRPIQFSQNHSILVLQRLILEKAVKSYNLNNYYLSLMISYQHDDEESNVEKSLTKAIDFFQSEDLGYKKGAAYDKDLILRLSLRFRRYKCAILILINDMNLHEVALNIALEHQLTSLGEFVLKSYDHYTLENQADSSRDFIIESTSTVDSKVVGKIKLEDDSFASRRKMWLIYAKYIVERVCKGENLNIAGLQTNTPEQTMATIGSKKSKIQSITDELFDQAPAAEDLPDFQNSRLNRALQYLLHLSYSSDRNSNVLTLKDLLPLFPETIKIIHFREEVVESLNLYNTTINQLGLEMQESASTAQKLKTQIEEHKSKEVKGSIYTIIEPGEACQLCSKLLIDKNFIIFPNCHHGFHKDCMVRFYLQLKGDYRFKKLFQNFKQTSSLADKTELDRLLQRECLLCNDSMLNKIEDPLFELDKEKLDWDI